MRSMKDILKVIRNGLAIYGGWCLLSGSASKKLEGRWRDMIDYTDDKIHEWAYGEPKEKVIEVDYEEVK